MAETSPRPQCDRPVLIFCPGLGRGLINSADCVADVIAAVIDRRTQGTYHAAPLSKVTAPRGLLLGKSVIEDSSDTPLLHVFELDYRRRLNAGVGSAVPATPPGAVRAAAYAVAAAIKLVVAARRTAKGVRAKLQLAYGLVAVVALALSAVVAAASWLIAAGAVGWLPAEVTTFLGLNATTTAVVTGSATFGIWAIVRRRLLAVAAIIAVLTRYLTEDRHRATVCLSIDDAVDGLRDAGWIGPVHILAYSMGSLVAIDSLFPARNSVQANCRVADAVQSLTTVGSPVDAVRMFRPDYFTQRVSRLNTGVPWRNVYIAMDIFASNFADGGDTPAAHGDSIDVAGRTPVSVPYGPTDLSLLDILAIKGFTTHDGYWGDAEEASCFDSLVDVWLADPGSQDRPETGLTRFPSVEIAR